MDAFTLSPSRGETSSLSNPRRVMIVDRNAIFRRGLRALFTDTEDFHVIAEANSCAEATAQLLEIPVDLVLIDVNPLDEDAIETVKLLRQQPDPPKVVLLANALDDQLLAQALLAGAVGYLSKDSPAEQIVSNVQHALEGEIAIPSSSAPAVLHYLVERCHMLEKELHQIHRSNASTSDHYYAHLEMEQFETSHDSTLPSGLKLLTRQEYKIFLLIRQGLSNKQIAVNLSISPYTVGKHVQHILRKLGVVNRTQVASYTSNEV